MSKKDVLSDPVMLKRLRDLVAMGPLYSCRGVGISGKDAALIRAGYVQVWDRDRDGWVSVADTDQGRARIMARQVAA